jgi:hypothetical protein
MEAHVELDTDYGSTSIADMTDIEELYTDNGSPSMDDMVEQQHEYDIDTMVETSPRLHHEQHRCFQVPHIRHWSYI